MNGAASNPTGGEIAIVGVACRFAGSPDAAAYWQNLVAARDCLTREDQPRVVDRGDGRSRVYSWGLAPARDRFDNALAGVAATAIWIRSTEFCTNRCGSPSKMPA